MARKWSYWTRNKLQILADYLPAFNAASQKKAEHRIYLDLMAGQPDNIERHTDIEFDGSPTVALKANPGFTVLRFGELGSKAEKLSAALAERFPGDNRYKVIKGDCNATIDEVLRNSNRSGGHRPSRSSTSRPPRSTGTPSKRSRGSARTRTGGRPSCGS